MLLVNTEPRGEREAPLERPKRGAAGICYTRAGTRRMHSAGTLHTHTARGSTTAQNRWKRPAAPTAEKGACTAGEGERRGHYSPRHK